MSRTNTMSEESQSESRCLFSRTASVYGTTWLTRISPPLTTLLLICSSTTIASLRMTMTVMTQVWHSLVDTLRQLPPMRPGTRISFDEDKPLRPLHAIQSEKQNLDEALDQLKVLIEMRRNEEQAQFAAASAMPIPTVQVSTPSSTGSGLKRKRRTSLSYSASPAPTPIPNSAESALSSVPSPLPSGRSGTPAGRELLGKIPKREGWYVDQLPLRHGRKAVFRQPPPRGSKDEEENWILVTIESMLNSDQTKYRVLDADEDQWGF